MKPNTFLTVLVMLFLIIISSCKKTDSDKKDEIVCDNSTFNIVYDFEMTPEYIEEDNKGNITILGKRDSITTIARMSPSGELLWIKEYPQLIGKAQGLVYIDENDFFIKTSTNIYNYELSEYIYDNVYKKSGHILDENYNYLPTYEYSGNFRPKLSVYYANQTYLTKINENGEIIWTKEYTGDACNGNSIWRIDDNNFLMLTSEFWGPYYKIIEYNGHVDTIDHPNDENKRVVYKINNEGEVLWSTEIDNIFNVSWGPTYYRDYQQSIYQSNDKIYVNTLNNTFELSLTGEVINTFQPKYNYKANWTYFMAKANETESFFFGRNCINDIFVDGYYLLKYNPELGQSEWEIKSYSYIFQISSYPTNFDFFILVDDETTRYIEKYNNNGDLLWHMDQMANIIKAACSGGVIIANENYTSKTITVIKTDSEGNY